MRCILSTKTTFQPIRKQHGFDNLDFSFHENSIQQSGERCVAIILIPDYDIARMYTGQYTQRADGSTEHLWEGEVRLMDEPWEDEALLTDDQRRRIDEIIDAGAPLIQSEFDVHLNDDTLIYAKNACGMNDTSAPFFLALYPVDENDLPANRKQHGFDNLDFGFYENGFWQIGERCVAIVRVPDYDIARIYTGQYIQHADGSTEHLWESEARLTEAAP